MTAFPWKIEVVVGGALAAMPLTLNSQGEGLFQVA
jgi:hypothetical protein